mgnify:CR=1 FL=1
MAIKEHGQGINVGTTELGASDSEALKINSSDGKEFLQLDTAADKVILKQVTEITSAAPTLTMTNTTASDSHLARDVLVAFKGTQSGGEVSTLGSIRAEHYNGSDDEAGLLTFSVNDGNDADAPSDYLKLRGGQAEFNVKMFAKVGSAAEPGISFYNDTNSGLYGDESGTVGLSSDGTSMLRVNNGGTKFGSGTVEIETTSPTFILDNSTSENASGGRESTIRFSGKKADGTAHYLAEIVGSQRDSSDNQNGQIIFKLNSGASGTSLSPYHYFDGASANVGFNGSFLNGYRLTLHGNDSNPGMLVRNSTSGDADLSGKTRIDFQRRQSGNEYSEAARIESRHDGAADDTKGEFAISTNTGSGLQEQLVINSAGNVGARRYAGIPGVQSDVYLQGAGAGGDVKVNNGDGRDLIVYNGSSTELLKIDASESTLAFNGKTHIKVAATNVTANAAADDFVIEGTGNTGASILTPNNVTGYLAFKSENGSGSDKDVMFLTGLYNSSNYNIGKMRLLSGSSANDYLAFETNGADRLTIDATGVSTTVGRHVIKGDLTDALQGTVSASSGSTAVTGSGTAFLTEIFEGSAIKLGSEIHSVAVVTDNTNLVLDAVTAGAHSSITAYTDNSPIFQVQSGDSRSLIEANNQYIRINGRGGPSDDSPQSSEVALYVDGGKPVDNNTNSTSIEINAVGSNGSELILSADGNYLGRIMAQSQKLQLRTQYSTQDVVFAPGQTAIMTIRKDEYAAVLQNSDIKLFQNEASSAGQEIAFYKSRNTTDEDATTAVNDNDVLGEIKWKGADGSGFETAAKIEAKVDGTPSGCLGVSTDFSSGVGAGYSTGTGVATTTTGGTGGSGATVNINSVNGSGAITSLSVNAKGSGYDTGDTFTVNGGSSLATCTVISGTPGEITLSTTAGSSANIHGANGGPIVRLLIDDQGITSSRTDTASLWNFQRYLSATPTTYGEFRTNAGGIFLHSAQAGHSSVAGFMFNYVERYRFTGDDGFHLINGNSVPSTSVTNGVKLYAEDVSSSSELKVRDEAGNITTLSPHNFSMTERSDPMAWSHYGKNPFVGKEINVDMMAVIKAVEQLSGQSFIQERDLDPSECRDWDTEEQLRVAKSQEAIGEWEQNSDEDKMKIPRPELYEAQPKPDWMT